MLDYKEIKPWLIKKHYAKRIPSVNHSFGLYDKETDLIEGVCTYGIPASDNLMKLCGTEHKKQVLELNRLIKSDNLEPNTSSWFVSQTFKLLSKPTIIVSYADPNAGHNGYTYQALNFLYTGTGGQSHEYIYEGRQLSSRHMNEGWFIKRKLAYDPNKTVVDNFIEGGGEIVKMEPKHRYVLFLGSKTDRKVLRSKLKFPALPYPKGDNTKYDTGKELGTQTRLFI